VLKLYAVINNRHTLMLGLSRENTKRLHDDKPIVVDLQALLQQATEDGPIQDIVLYAGETDREIHEAVASFIPDVPPFVEPTPGY